MTKIAKTTSKQTPSFLTTVKLPLTLAVSTCLLVACSSTQNSNNAATGTTTTIYPNTATTTPTAPNVQTAATGSGVLDSETLAILDDLLEARDMTMVEGDRIEVQRYGDLWDRVRRGYKITQPNYNPRIESQKAWFSSRQRYLNSLTARASRYLHHTVTEAERRGIPTELALLPIIESSYDPAATSNAAAAGLWQFIPSTGRIYGLNQTGSYDGRRDVIESTRAAYDFLTSLYNQFGSWELALAAYNAGPGRIQRAIDANAAQGRPTDYWSLQLPTETMNYVPRFMAVAQIVQNPSLHGVSLPPIANHAHFRAVPVNQGVSLSEVSSVTGVSVADLQLLNPALTSLRVDVAGPSRVLIPNSVPSNFDASLSAISGYGYGGNVAQNTSYIAPVSSTALADPSSTATLSQTNTLPTTAARVTPNKTIVQEPPLSQEERDFIAAQIAQNATVPVQPINPRDGNIELEAVQTAQSVLDARGQTKSLDYNARTQTLPQQQQMIPPPVQPPISYIPPTSQKDVQPPTKTSAKSTSYVVQSGDTLTSVAKKHGLTVAQLSSYNGISTTEKIKKGTRLSLVPTGKTQSTAQASTPKPTPAKPTQAVRSDSHTVQAGETLSGIASKYNLTVRQLAEYNAITTTTLVQKGQKLWLVPNKIAKPKGATQSYKVQTGDSLSSVAAKYNIGVSELAAANNMSSTDGLVRGKTIVIPSGAKATPAATATTQPAATTGKTLTKTESYKVKSGDSLTSLADRYGVSVADLAKTNNLAANAKLVAGSTIKVPKLTTTHTVKSGESLNSLAKKYEIGVAELAQMNGLKATDKLQKGQTLTVPNK